MKLQFCLISPSLTQGRDRPSVDYSCSFSLLWVSVFLNVMLLFKITCHTLHLTEYQSNTLLKDIPQHTS